VSKRNQINNEAQVLVGGKKQQALGGGTRGAWGVTAGGLSTVKTPEGEIVYSRYASEIREGGFGSRNWITNRSKGEQGRATGKRVPKKRTGLRSGETLGLKGEQKKRPQNGKDINFLGGNI